MKRLLILFGFLMAVLLANAKIYNIVEIGADKQGFEKCTKIVNNAIEQAAAEGGGTIYFPAGRYLTGPILMKSNITLYLESGAWIQFSSDFDDFLPYVQVRYEGIFMKTFTPLIYAVGAENIAIKGEGTIDGNGSLWWSAIEEIMGDVRTNGQVTAPNKYQQLWVEQNSDLAESKYGKNQFFRPPFIQFIECQNVNIESITIKNSPFWTVNPIGCNDVRISGITILNPEEGRNTDGVNPSSCSNVRISDCFISVGDDCITIKSGRDQYGRDYGKPCENITVTNCVMQAGHGGVVIGSEMSGGVKNVTISNCIFDGTDNGIRLKSARGRGGVVENIRVSNVVMNNIRRIGFIFNLFYDKGTSIEPVTERTPIFRNIHISDVTGVNVEKVGMLTGIEEMPVEGISFSNISMKAKMGFIAETGNNLRFSNVDIAVEEGPSFSFANCHKVVLDDVRSDRPIKNEPIIEINASSQVLINNCYQIVPADIFSKITNSEVLFGKNFLDQVKQIK